MQNKKWIKLAEKDKDYKRFVGNPNNYEDIGIIIFEFLISLGLKATNDILDIGCGSLRVGKYLIKFLDNESYFGIEPNKWLVDSALEMEIDCDTLKKKNPNFDNNNKFKCDIFKMKFDFIIANSIFIHATKEQIKSCIHEVKRVMHNDSIFIFNYIEGKQDNQENDWTYPSHVKYKRKTIIDMLDNEGLTHNMGYHIKYPGLQRFVVVRKK